MLSLRRKKRSGAIKRIRSKFGRGVVHEILVFCSGKNIYAQVVNLKDRKTEFAVSTCKKGDKKNHRNVKFGYELGRVLADKCRDNKITNASFNRAEKIFHGVIKAVADGFYQK